MSGQKCTPARGKELQLYMFMCKFSNIIYIFGYLDRTEKSFSRMLWIKLSLFVIASIVSGKKTKSIKYNCFINSLKYMYRKCAVSVSEMG